MPGLVEMRFDLGELERDLKTLGAKGGLIMARALNRAAASGKTAMTRAVVADTGLRSKDVSREIVVDKANRTRPVAALTIKGARIPLIAFQARGPEPSRGRGRGVSYRLPSGRGRVPSAFIATMPPPSKHRGVFVRKGRKRLAIRELRGPSLPHVFEKKLDVFRTVAQDTLIKNLRHEISWEQAKQTGGGEE